MKTAFTVYLETILQNQRPGLNTNTEYEGWQEFLHDLPSIRAQYKYRGLTLCTFKSYAISTCVSRISVFSGRPYKVSTKLGTILILISPFSCFPGKLENPRIPWLLWPSSPSGKHQCMGLSRSRDCYVYARIHVSSFYSIFLNSFLRTVPCPSWACGTLLLVELKGPELKWLSASERRLTNLLSNVLFRSVLLDPSES